MDTHLEDLRRRLGDDPSVRGPYQRALVRAGRSPAEAWQDLPVSLRLSFDDERLSSAGRARLADDVTNLDMDRVLLAFPRDAKGRLPLKERTALLASYPSDAKLSRDRALWLAVKSPKRRKDPQELSVVLEPLIGKNHAHLWAEARWLWDTREPLSDLGSWGVEGVSALTFGAEAIESLSGRAAHTPAERVALCASLQDAGRSLEALDLCGVELDPAIRVAAEGGGVRPVDVAPGLLDDVKQGLVSELTAHAPLEGWGAVLREFLRVCAPWRFEALLQREAREWLQAKASRRPKAPAKRLFALPAQGQQSKTSLVLTSHGRDGAGPRLILDDTSINDRYPEVLWRRPDTPPFSPRHVA